MHNPDKRRDHFVARTYLRRFAKKSSKNTEVLNVYDRINEKYIKPSPEGICCEIGWDIIDNIQDKYVLRKLLQTIEPNLSDAIDRILVKDFSNTDRTVLSWYLGIVFLLNPEYLDSAKETHEKIVKASADILIDNGTIDMPPEVEKLLGGKHNFNAEVDFNYIKAFIARLLPDIVFCIYSSSWYIIRSSSEEEFFTSDKPFYFMCCPHNSNIYPKYIPLDPKHLLFLPPPNLNNYSDELEDKPEFTIENAGGIGFVNVDRQGVELFNKYTISNASRFIIAHNLTEQMETLIKENIKFKTSVIQNEIPTGNGKYIIPTTHCNRKIKDKEKEFEQLIKILLTAT